MQRSKPGPIFDLACNEDAATLGAQERAAGVIRDVADNEANEAILKYLGAGPE